MTEPINRKFVLRSAENCAALYAVLKQNWQAMAEMNEPLMVKVESYKSKRSREQNKLYWSILEQISQSHVNGKKYPSNIWNEHFKALFLPHEDLPFGGSVPISTKELNVSDFNEYLEKVRAYGIVELGVEFI